MTIKYESIVSAKTTPQSEPIPGSAQVENSAGGYSFPVDDWVRLDRFLILGTEGGSYYASERKLTLENAKAVKACIDADGARTVARIVEISEAARAPKNDPALFALAMAAASDPKTRTLALDALPRVARIGTHLFTFISAYKEFGGFGRQVRRKIGAWYTDRDPDSLAYQLCKYRQRGGWSHRDVLRLVHRGASSLAHRRLFEWVGSNRVADGLPDLVAAFIELQTAKTDGAVLAALAKNENLSWEMIPTERLGSPEIWQMLISRLPYIAFVRNLGRMTASGALKPLTPEVKLVVERLGDVEALRKSKIHPMGILLALATYKQGHGDKGKLSWEPIGKIVDALDAAFLGAFPNIVPSGKRMIVALDVSGSMAGGSIAGSGLTPREGAAAMAMIHLRTEPLVEITAFSSQMISLRLSASDSLADAVTKTDNLPFGGTDCSLPMLWAIKQQIDADIFLVYTDSETWAGGIHPVQALQKYRRERSIPAKLVVVGMVSNGFSIADPKDAGMLDVVGFDTAVPGLINDFAGR